MKTFLTVLFWLPVTLICLGLFINYTFALLPVFAIGVFSPYLAVGLLFGIIAVNRRN